MVRDEEGDEEGRKGARGTDGRRAGRAYERRLRMSPSTWIKMT